MRAKDGSTVRIRSMNETGVVVKPPFGDASAPVEFVRLDRSDEVRPFIASDLELTDAASL